MTANGVLNLHLLIKYSRASSRDLYLIQCNKMEKNKPTEKMLEWKSRELRQFMRFWYLNLPLA